MMTSNLLAILQGGRHFLLWILLGKTISQELFNAEHANFALLRLYRFRSKHSMNGNFDRNIYMYLFMHNHDIIWINIIQQFISRMQTNYLVIYKICMRQFIFKMLTNYLVIYKILLSCFLCQSCLYVIPITYCILHVISDILRQ